MDISDYQIRKHLTTVPICIYPLMQERTCSLIKEKEISTPKASRNKISVEDLSLKLLNLNIDGAQVASA
jgi:hypothetical protein